MKLGKQGLRDTYFHLFQKNDALLKTKVRAIKPFAAYWYFLESMERYIGDGSFYDPNLVVRRLEALLNGLTSNFKFIVITLEETDDAQVIFETLNTGGEPLTAMDLVRNNIFQRAMLEGNETAQAVEHLLNEFHGAFWDREIKQGRLKRKAVDHYLTHALTAETGREISLSELYADYKRFQRSQDFEDARAEAKTLVRYTAVYKQLADTGSHSKLAELGEMLNQFDVGTATPIIFVVATSDADEEAKNRIYSLLQSFIIRRAVCGLTTEGRNLLFAELARNLRKNEVTIEFFKSELIRRTGDSRRFPDNDEFRKAFMEQDIYEVLISKRTAYILYQLEGQLRDKFDEVEKGLLPQLTVEHVLPLDWIVHWHLKDGRMAPSDGIPLDSDMAEDMRTRNAMLHKIGNLTLLTGASNSKLKNRPFSYKKDHIFKRSLLCLNRKIAAMDSWDETVINRRSKDLFDLATRIWPSVYAQDNYDD